MKSHITTLFLDVGGVLLTNAWDRKVRRRAAQEFHLDFEAMDERHHLTFDTYEEGKLTLDEYLDRVIFCAERTFSRKDFTAFMMAQSHPHPEMIDLVCRLKSAYHLKTAIVSNEGRELTVYRIQRFQLYSFVDFFIASSFVHLRKPDADIYRLALDVSQSKPGQVAYIEDRRMFVEIARSLGLEGIEHTGLETTRAALTSLGLVL
jgi:putative hydrolase of the HAD superfamily